MYSPRLDTALRVLAAYDRLRAAVAPRWCPLHSLPASFWIGAVVDRVRAGSR